MLKNLRYFCTLLLMAVVGVAFAQTQETTTYVFSAKNWSATSGGSSANWTSGKDGNQFQSGRGVQVTSGASGANGTSPISFENVSKVVVTYSTNASKGKGSINVKVGSNTEKSFTVSPVGTEDKNTTFEYESYETGAVTITVNCTENSIYVKSIEITTTSDSGTTLEDNDLALSSTALTFDLYNNAEPQVINYTTSSTGAVTIPASNFFETAIDETNKTITVTPVAVTNGVKEATVNQAADDTYKSGSATFTVDITDSAPFAGGNVTFDATVDKGTTTTNADGDEMSKSVVTVSSTSAAFATAEYRIYSGSTTTISTTQGTITKIVFTKTGNYDLANLSTTTGTYDSSTGIWTGDAESVSFSAKAQVRLILIDVTVTVPGDEPYISANNVNIAYDATEGEIAYTINNPVTGTLLQATADADWISNITVGESAITFDATANEANTERVATFTLTYEGAEDKTVTVTQAAAPTVYTTIPDLFAAATATSTPVTITFNNWVISAVNGSNAYLTDNAGNGLIIYKSNHGFNVNDVLSGTASCNLVLYRGSAELTDLTATTDGLTVTADGTVTEQNIAINTLGGVNTGALLHFDGLTFDGENLVDADNNTIKPYNTLYAYEFEAGKTYNVTGIYLQYNNTKELLPRSEDDVEEVVSEDAAVTLANYNISVAAEGGEAFLTVQYQNIDEIVADIQFYEEDGVTETTADSYDWLVVELDDDNNVNYLAVANTGEERKAYFKVFALDNNSATVYSELITITQEAYVAPSYAVLPFSYNDGRANIEDTDGLTQEGLGTDYNVSSNPTTQLKFDGTGDWLLLQFDEEPGKLTFDIKGNSFSGGTFTVQTSEDGVTFTDLASYTELGATQNEEFKNLDANVRFIKWIYTNKSSGNVGLGNIKLEKPATTVTITINEGYAATTFSCDKALDFSNMEITAFIITDENGTTAEVTRVPANTGIYVEGAEGNYEVPILADETEADDVTGNKLIPTVAGETLVSNDEFTYYAYGKQKGTEAFFKISTDTAKGLNQPANKAVLAIEAAAGAKDVIFVNGDVTGIDSIDNEQLTNSRYFTVDGKLVKGQPTQKGIYIVNGRKVVIK